MAKFDRSLYKAADVSDLKNQAKDVDDIASSGGSAKFPKFLNLDKEGVMNVIRIYPPHPGYKSFAEPKMTHWVKVQKKDKDGALMTLENGAPDIGSRTVFSGLIHDVPESKCIIEEYIQNVKRHALEDLKLKGESFKKYMSIINGYRVGGKYQGALKMDKKWVVYANLGGKFGRVELPVSVKNKINSIAANQIGDGPMTDPITGPDDGRNILIKYNKGQNVSAENRYEVTPDLKVCPLTDAELEVFSEATPLADIYKEAYKYSDFELAMQGLKAFDEKSTAILVEWGFDAGYGVFDRSDEFMDIAESIAERLILAEPEETEESSDESESTEDANKPEPIKKEPVKVEVEEKVEEKVVPQTDGAPKVDKIAALKARLNKGNK